MFPNVLLARYPNVRRSFILNLFLRSFSPDGIFLHYSEEGDPRSDVGPHPRSPCSTMSIANHAPDLSVRKVPQCGF